MDDVVFYLLIFAGALAVLIVVFAGVLTPVAGKWRDGNRVIELRQIAFWVTGRCEHSDGFEDFSGLVFFGRMRLHRSPHGDGLLSRLGYDPRVFDLVEGLPLAYFDFYLTEGDLVGTIERERLRFSYSPPQIESIVMLDKVDRTWRRD